VSFFTLTAEALNGLLLSRLYAITALGFSLIFGVMGLMNVVHHELSIKDVMAGVFLTKK
jgi:branched-subunit amino acid ABC-type transport system permease component